MARWTLQSKSEIDFEKKAYMIQGGHGRPSPARPAPASTIVEYHTLYGVDRTRLTTRIPVTVLGKDSQYWTYRVHGDYNATHERWDPAPPRSRASQLATAKALEAADDALPWCELA